MAANEKIVRYLQKSGPVDLDDPMVRLELIGKLGKMEDREKVRLAINAWSAQKGDSVINTFDERQQFAMLVTRSNNRISKNSTPFARTVSKTRDHLRRRKWTFDKSSGSGVRKFDNQWRGYLYADVKTKRNADKLARLLRTGDAGKVRVVPYQAKNKTYYSVYSQRTADVVNRRTLKNAKRHNDLKVRTALGKRRIISTRKNINKMGIQKRRH
jgi:hypothetical protein